MREIKFRAWDKVYKQMVTDFVSDKFRIAINITGEVIGYEDQESSDDETYVGEYPDRFELMQYTGLRDKNGVEIYPHGIIKWDGPFYNGPVIGEVIEHYGEVGPCQGPNVMEYVLKCGPCRLFPKGYVLYNLWDLSCMKVIGNIYENPDLLEGDPDEP
jgi:hypothetical protein